MFKVMREIKQNILFYRNFKVLRSVEKLQVKYWEKVKWERLLVQNALTTKKL